jgi:hypothetical protein
MAMWVAAAAPPDNEVQPGWLGFFVVLALGIVTYLLWRNMNTHLKRVNFESPSADEEGDSGKPTGSPEGSDVAAGEESAAEKTGDELPDSAKRDEI